MTLVYFSLIILDSIIKLTEAQNAVSSVYYISDHGENLFDDDQNLFSTPMQTIEIH